MKYANSEDPDEHAHPCNLIWAYSVDILIFKADYEGPPQPAQMLLNAGRLIWACVVRNCIGPLLVHCASYDNLYIPSCFVYLNDATNISIQKTAAQSKDDRYSFGSFGVCFVKQ